MWGAWHMMTAAGEVRDVGDFHGPLLMHFRNPRREQLTTLQALVDGWLDAGEGMRRLIYEAPLLMCVQISRFHGRRQIRKLLHQVELGNGRFHLPCRERPGFDASTLCYRVTALTVHLGKWLRVHLSAHWELVTLHIIPSTKALCILMMAVRLYQFCKGMCMPSCATCISCGASEWSEDSCNLHLDALCILLLLISFRFHTE
eukprot:s2768_g11.t1